MVCFTLRAPKKQFALISPDKRMERDSLFREHVVEIINANIFNHNQTIQALEAAWASALDEARGLGYFGSPERPALWKVGSSSAGITFVM